MALDDPFERLLDHLRNGRPLPPRARRGMPSIYRSVHVRFWQTTAIVVAAAVLWFVAASALNWYRDNHVETWTGPTTTVTSGGQLAGCPAASAVGSDTVYPNWVRFDGRVYIRSTRAVPVVDSATGPDGTYPATGYTLGSIRLLRSTTSPAARAGDEIVLDTPGTVGSPVFVADPSCR